MSRSQASLPVRYVRQLLRLGMNRRATSTRSLGNWMLAAGAMDRWWGPGWDGSLILSSNARPIPSLSLQRSFAEAPPQRWLRWVGPWTMSVLMGEMESDRAVPNALFFGWQLTFRPLPHLEIGLERTAQWCGDDRPCDFDDV